MESLLTTPGLPDKRVSSVLVSSEYPAIITALNKLGIQTLTVPTNSMFEDGICSHSDCVFFQLDNKRIFADKCIYDSVVKFLTITKNLKELDCVIIGETVGSPYPNDVKLNCTRIADKIICNTNYISDALKVEAASLGIELIHANQGYSACSTIVLNDEALITDDESIYNAVNRSGIDSLLISKGSVKLKNHNYGFLGGTCGMIDKNLLAFTGDIKTHTDSESIIAFLNKHSVNYVCLIDDVLTDIGGIIPLTQDK